MSAVSYSKHGRRHGGCRRKPARILAHREILANHDFDS
jgi:hypothetical protein